MGQITQHKIDLYYNAYKEIEITFNKDIIGLTQLISDEIYLKCGNLNLPCILHSTSFIGTKVIAQLDPAFFDILREHSNWISIRFAFRRADTTNPLTFFIKSKVMSQSPFKAEKPNLFFINATYNQKPPDALIEILGMLLEAKSNAEQRKDERINITPEIAKSLQLKNTEAVLILDKNQRKCLLRDLSFTGAKIVAQGSSVEYLNKQAIMVLNFKEHDEKIPLFGKITRCEEIKGRQDFTVLGFQYVIEKVPIHYKMRINEFFSKRLRVTGQPAENGEQPAPPAKETKKKQG